MGTTTATILMWDSGATTRRPPPHSTLVCGGRVRVWRLTSPRVRFSASSSSSASFPLAVPAAPPAAVVGPALHWPAPLPRLRPRLRPPVRPPAPRHLPSPHRFYRHLLVRSFLGLFFSFSFPFLLLFFSFSSLFNPKKSIRKAGEKPEKRKRKSAAPPCGANYLAARGGSILPAAQTIRTRH